MKQNVSIIRLSIGSQLRFVNQFKQSHCSVSINHSEHRQSFFSIAEVNYVSVSIQITSFVPQTNPVKKNFINILSSTVKLRTNLTIKSRQLFPFHISITSSSPTIWINNRIDNQLYHFSNQSVQSHNQSIVRPQSLVLITELDTNSTINPNNQFFPTNYSVKLHSLFSQ